MFSCIIPTMHRDPAFPIFLTDLVRFHLISEVILIDNDPSKRPNLPVFHHPKIILLEQETNIGVNCAWNLGVDTSMENHLCVINDDVRVDLRIFYRAESLLDNSNTGACFISLGDHPSITSQVPCSSGTIDIRPHTTEHLWGTGTCFFIHKRNWEPIPEGMKIYCGDNWCFEGQIQQRRTNYLLENAIWNTPNSVTSRSFESEFSEKDKELYAKYNTERIKRNAI